MTTIERREYRVATFRRIAVLGEAPLAFWLLRFLTSMLLGKASIPFSLLAFPVLVGAGYFIQFLFIRREVWDDRELHFRPEGRIYLPRRAIVLSYLLTAGTGALLSSVCFAIVEPLVPPYNVEFAPLLFFPSFALCMLWGQTLAATRAATFARDQHMIEVSCFYIFYAVLVPRTSALEEGLFALTILLFFLSYAFRLNQQGLAKLQAMASTVHVGRKMILYSLLSTLSLLARSVVLFLAILSSVTFLFVLGQALLWFLLAGAGMDSSGYAVYMALFGKFPTEQPWINIPLFVLGCFALPLLVLWFLSRKNSSLRARIGKLTARFTALFAHRIEAKTGAMPMQVERETEYTDRIRPVRRDPPPFAYPDNYPAVCKQIEKLPSAREKIAYAYRVMVDCLIRANLGVRVTHTPKEIARLLARRNVMTDADMLAHAFETAVYAPTGEEIPDAHRILDRILQVIRIYLSPHERGATQ